MVKKKKPTTTEKRTKTLIQWLVPITQGWHKNGEGDNGTIVKWKYFSKKWKTAPGELLPEEPFPVHLGICGEKSAAPNPRGRNRGKGFKLVATKEVVPAYT